MLKRLGIVAVAALVIGAGTANAAVIYDSPALSELSGSRSTPDANGIVAGGPDVSLVTVSWVIQQMGPVYRYDYTFTHDSQQGISHFVLDLSDSCSLTSGCVTEVFSVNGLNIEYGTYNEQNGNPGFPGEIYGIKFNVDNGGQTFGVSFYSNRVPVYGDFYAKGGSPENRNNPNGFFAYNTGAVDHLSENVKDFIARPDTLDIVVPEPASVLLLGAGLIGLAARMRRRQ